MRTHVTIEGFELNQIYSPRMTHTKSALDMFIVYFSIIYRCVNTFSISFNTPRRKQYIIRRADLSSRRNTSLFISYEF